MRTTRRLQKKPAIFKVDWEDIQVRRILGEHSDEVAARRLGVTDRTIRKERKRLGITANRNKKWTPIITAMLGRVPDRFVAEMLKISKNAVEYRREKLGISEFKGDKRRRLNR